MRIGCLQFAPQVGDVEHNLNRADSVLSRSNAEGLDLLVLPELAFSGYNFTSLQHITPYLEPTTSGQTSLWARTTALKYNCIVTVGYPEKVDITKKWPTSPEYYNSAITVNRDGETIANYRKSFLYFTDETWALEGPDGFFDGTIPGLGNVAMGICKWPTKSFERMDLNPYKFEAAWSQWEFAYHILHKEANLVILSMAWLTRENAKTFSVHSEDPDMETLSYWLARLEPIIRAEDVGEIIVVLANRCGTEDKAVYAGTSCVLGIDAGEVKLYGVLGRGEKELLVVDTNEPPEAKIVLDSPPVELPHPSFNTSHSSGQNISAQNPPQTGNEQLFPNPRDSLSIDQVLHGSAPISPVSPSAIAHYFFPASVNPVDKIASLRSSTNRPHHTTPLPSSSANRSGTPIPISGSAPVYGSASTPSADHGLVTREDTSTPFEDLSSYARPSSPKSRNASRTGTRVPREDTSTPFDDLSSYADSSSPKPRNDSRTRTRVLREDSSTPFTDLSSYARSSSPKSRNDSRTGTRFTRESSSRQQERESRDRTGMQNDQEFVAIVDFGSGEIETVRRAPGVTAADEARSGSPVRDGPSRVVAAESGARGGLAPGAAGRSESSRPKSTNW